MGCGWVRGNVAQHSTGLSGRVQFSVFCVLHYRNGTASRCYTAELCLMSSSAGGRSLDMVNMLISCRYISTKTAGKTLELGAGKCVVRDVNDNALVTLGLGAFQLLGLFRQLHCHGKPELPGRLRLDLGVR